MQAQKYLADYARRADKVLYKFFEAKKSEVKDIGERAAGTPVALDMLGRYQNFVRGGKKLRGALIQLGYQCAGGQKKEVLLASTCIEVIHSFLLMHDDIMDLDVLRRGQPTIHKQYEKQHGQLGFKRESTHFGISMGINLGDLGVFFGMEILGAAKLASERKARAMTALARLLERTGFGQGLDVTYEHLGKVSEEDVLRIHVNKTAHYTVSGPLKIGALLAGGAAKQIRAMEKFGEPVGIAFQLRDDELGLFSDEKTLGKPIASDIREGKNTILRIKALELASPADQKFLLWAYGNRSLDSDDIKRVRQITIESGSLAYSQDFGRKLVEKGKKFIPQISKNPKLAQTLSALADFMVERNS